MQRKSRDTEKR